MLPVEIRPTHRFLQLMAKIERSSGQLDRLLGGPPGPDEQSLGGIFSINLELGISAASALDSSTPGGLLIRQDVLEWQQRTRTGAADQDHEILLEQLETKCPNLARFLESHHSMDSSRFSFKRENLEQLYAQSFACSEEKIYRSSPGYLLTPEKEIVFPTVSAFVLEARTEELLSWTENELRVGLYHPLLILGSFYLLFLQTSPFIEGNHRFAALLLWQLLLREGYSFVGICHFSPFFLQNEERYFNALRRAEKSAYQDNWSTLNIWLEYLLEVLSVCAKRALRQCEHRLDSSSLSSVQRQILGVIKQHGSATRERIASETGINLSTVKYNLSVLSSKGHLRRQGGGRTTSYAPV